MPLMISRHQKFSPDFILKIYQSKSEMNSRPQRLVTPKLVERKCEKCACFLAIHNLEKLCSPCANQEKRKSWLSKSLNPSFVTSAEELAKIGIIELITINKLTAKDHSEKHCDNQGKYNREKERTAIAREQS